MIVQCGQCSTKFRLDDAKVKDAGVKVRCSKCRHVFTVFPGAPSEEASFEALLEGFGPGKGEEAPAQDAGTSIPGHDPVPSAESTQYSASDDLAGWDAEAAASGVPAADAGTQTFDFGFSEDTAFAGDSGQTAEPAPQPQAEEDVFGSAASDSPSPFPVDTSDSIGESGLAEWNVAATEPGGSTQVESEPMGSSEVDSPFFSAAPEVQLSVEENPLAGLLSPIEGHESEVPVSAKVSSEPEAPSGPDGEESPTQAAASTASDASEEELPPLAIASRRKGHTVFPIIVTGISIVFLLLLAAGGLYFMKEDPQGLEKMGLGSLSKWMGIEAAEEGSISLRSTSSSFIANREAGELLVIRGEAVNGYRKPRAAVQVRGVVFGQKGEVLIRKTAYCGNALTNEQLATLPLAKIEAAMNNQFGDSLSNLGVQPGKAIPFVLVFSQVPKDAVDFGVEVAGSTVATQ